MYLICDIGGTRTRLGHSSNGKELTSYQVFDTPHDYQAGLAIIADYIRSYVSGESVNGIVVGVAGPLDPTRQRMVRAPHLPGWNNQPLKADLQRITNCTQVVLVNDTALVGLGEAVRGAGRGGEIVAYITFSTGVGGVRISHGKIDDTKYGFEPGHQLLRAGSNLVEWEDLVSGAGIEQKYQKLPIEINDPFVWDGIMEFAALGLHNVIVNWSPDTVVLGGGLVSSGKLQVEVLAQKVGELLKIFPELPKFYPAALGDIGGLHGGLVLLS